MLQAFARALAAMVKTAHLSLKELSKLRLALNFFAFRLAKINFPFRAILQKPTM